MYIYIKNDAGNEGFKIQNEQELKQFIDFCKKHPDVIGVCIDDDGSNPRHFRLNVNDEQQLIGYPVRMIDSKPVSILPVYYAVTQAQTQTDTETQKTFLFSSTPQQASERYLLTEQDKTRFFSYEEIKNIVEALLNRLRNFVKEVSSTVSNHTSKTSLSNEQQRILVDDLIVVGDGKHDFRAQFRNYLESLEPHVIKAIIQHKPNMNSLTADEQNYRETVLSTFFNRNALHQLCERASQMGANVTPEMARHLYIDLFQNRLAETHEQVPESEVISDHVEFSAETTNQIKIMAPQTGMTDKEQELFQCAFNLLAIPLGSKNYAQYLSQPLYVKHLDEINLMLRDIDGVIQNQNQTTQHLEYQNVYDAILAAFSVENWTGFEKNVAAILKALDVLNLPATEKELFQCTFELLDAALNNKSIFQYLSQPLYVKHRDEIHLMLNNILGVIQDENQSTQHFKHPKVYDVILAAFDVSDWRRFERPVTDVLNLLKIELALKNNRVDRVAIKKYMDYAIEKKDWNLCAVLLNNDAAKQFSSHDINDFVKKITNAKIGDTDFSMMQQVLEKILNMSPEYGVHRLTISNTLDTSIEDQRWEMVATLLPFVKEDGKRTDRIIEKIDQTIFDDEHQLPQHLFQVLTGEQMKHIFSLTTLKSFMASCSSNEAKQTGLVALETHGLLQPLLREAWKNYKKENPEERGSVASALFCQLSEARHAYQLTQKTMSDLEPHRRMMSRIVPIEAYIREHPNEPFAKMMGDYLNQTTLTDIISAGSIARVTPTEASSSSPSVR